MGAANDTAVVNLLPCSENPAAAVRHVVLSSANSRHDKHVPLCMPLRSGHYVLYWRRKESAADDCCSFWWMKASADCGCGRGECRCSFLSAGLLLLSLLASGSKALSLSMQGQVTSQFKLRGIIR